MNGESPITNDEVNQLRRRVTDLEAALAQAEGQRAKLLAQLENRSKAEEQLRAIQEQEEELIRAVSHDLRTPLTSIQGFAQLLERSLGNEEVDRRVRLSIKHIIGGARRMNDMIQDLVDAARLETGSTSPPPKARRPGLPYDQST